jgi:hypothetical protein
MSRKVYGTIYILSFALFPWLVLSPHISLLINIPLRLGIFCLLSVGGAFLFQRAWPDHGWGVSLLITTLGYGFVYKLASFIPDISTYPFSLGWSEGSRYYYASLWLSKHVYGQLIPPSILHPSRYLLQSIPFLIPGSTLWLNRFWQVFLWVTTASLTSWLLVRRLNLPGRNKPLVITLGMIFWGFLFLFQGPIYYHLLFMVILILWGFDGTRFWRTLILVLIASLWAGISRINWLPVPGLLASALYLLEVKVTGKSLWKYFLPPIIWVLVGTGAAYASQQAYRLFSGNPQTWFGSSFTSDLLWYRLLPNPTFPLGILPSAFLISLPLIGLMSLRLIKHWREFYLIRILGLVAILGVLFLGGVIVSVKIGGGSYIFFNKFLPDYPTLTDENVQALPATLSDSFFSVSNAVLIAGALIIPLYFTLSAGGQLPMRDFPAAQAALQTINTNSQQMVEHGGEVLFISQRHLLTFNEVKNVPLVPEDELVFLMEMAMSDNPAYMDAFHTAISNQRFDLIVSDPLVIQYQGRSHSFGEENDAWVRNVSVLILCYYEPSIILDSVGVVLYMPRTNPCQ